jgi:hypothetical protein
MIMSLLEQLVRLYFKSHAGKDVTSSDLLHFVELGMEEDPGSPQLPLAGAIRSLLDHGQSAGWVTITSRDPLCYRGTPPEGEEDIYPGDPLQDQIVVTRINNILGID